MIYFTAHMCTGTDFASFSAQLNRQFGAGSDTEVAATIGRKLTLARAWGELLPLLLASGSGRLGTHTLRAPMRIAGYAVARSRG